MKKTFLLIALMSAVVLSTYAQEQKSFKVKGNFASNSFNGKKAVLMCDLKTVCDSTTIKNNTFEFEGKTQYPVTAEINVGDESIYFLLVNDEIEISIPGTELQEDTIRYRNSRARDIMNEYTNENHSIFYQDYKKLATLNLEKATEEQKREVKARQDTLVLTYLDYLIKKYNRMEDKEGLSFIVDDLTRMMGTREYPEKIKVLYELVPEVEQSGMTGQQINLYLKSSR